MEFIRNTLKKFPNDSFLNNLKEQGEGWYRNTEVPEDVDPLFEKIADDLCRKISEVNFTDHDFPMHKFIDCDKELANEFGVKIISACAYSGDEGVYTMDSNYIYSKRDNEDDILFIDLYFCELDTIKETRGKIIQELYNFIRDLEWVDNNTYEEEIEKMKTE